MNLGAIILAAGASTRLGSPKQLLLHSGDTLLRHAAQTALAAACRPVVVVLGANAERMRAPLAELDVEIVLNAAWAQGMGTSVRRGMTTLTRLEPQLDAVLLLVCDQPLVQPGDLQSLVAAFASAESADHVMAAAKYAATIGVPAIFGRAHFAALSTLPDAAGAKRVLLEHPGSVMAVEMPAAAVDIDTREQYEQLTK